MKYEKRIIPVTEGPAVEEDEEELEKMETFFALIRGFHEARNRRRNELNHNHETEMTSNKLMKKRKSDDRESGWVPSFQREDFTGQGMIEFRKKLQPPNCDNIIVNKKEAAKENENEGGLDLKLAL